MSANTYKPERDVTPMYLATVDGWIKATGEVLVILRYLRGAGSGDYALVSTPQRFRELISVCPDGTDIVVVRGPQLNLRGVVDEAFVRNAKKLVPETREYMFVRTRPLRDHDPRCWGGHDIGHGMLEDDLGEEIGEEVAFGPCPEFMRSDQEGIISASKGGIDGPR